MSKSLTYVIPAFNAGDYLLTAVQSCLDQCWDGQVKVIVVNDGSTDDSILKLTSTLGHMRNLEIHSQPNQGESAAVNAGARLVTSEFMCVLSADDLVHELHAKTMVSQMSEANCVVAYPDWNQIDPSGRLLAVTRTRVFSRRRLWEFFECLPGPGAVIRVGSVEHQLRTGKFRYIDDYVQWLQLSLVGDFKRVSKPLASWRSHPKQATRLGFDSIAAERLELLRLLRAGELASPVDINLQKMQAGLAVLNALAGLGIDLKIVDAKWSDFISIVFKRALSEPLNISYGLLKSARRAL